MLFILGQIGHVPAGVVAVFKSSRCLFINWQPPDILCAYTFHAMHPQQHGPVLTAADCGCRARLHHAHAGPD